MINNSLQFTALILDVCFNVIICLGGVQPPSHVTISPETWQQNYTYA